MKRRVRTYETRRKRVWEFLLPGASRWTNPVRAETKVGAWEVLRRGMRNRANVPKGTRVREVSMVDRKVGA